MESAFVCLTSHHIVPRSLAFVRSLQNVGALTGAKCYVLCFDSEASSIIKRNTDPHLVQALSIDDVPEVKPFTSRTIGQLAFASKPFLLRWVLEHEGAEKVVYLDSDTWFVRNPSFLWDQLDRGDILLVPAVIDPQVTLSGWELATRNAQRTGYYNAGLVGCRRSATGFLDWWANRCAAGTHTDYYLDIHGDQKYLSWVPCLFRNVVVLRHHGLNVKHFSVRHASLERHPDGTVSLSGDHVVYFHFSQQLGNLEFWPEELRPEVGRYLAELEQSRRDCNTPFVDMPYQANEALARPLLPRYGLDAICLRFVARLRETRHLCKSIVSRCVARVGRRAPFGVRDLLVKRYLRRGWKERGDCAVEALPDILARSAVHGGETEILFCGATQAALYLAYHRRNVLVHDPFQGYYNSELNDLFNVQFKRVDQLRTFLGVAGNLKMVRRPYTDNVATDRTMICWIAGRLGPDIIERLVAQLVQQGTLRVLGVLYDSAWGSGYRTTLRELLEPHLSGTSPCLTVRRDLDVYDLS